jgi:hypothetical protein
MHGRRRKPNSRRLLRFFVLQPSSPGVERLTVGTMDANGFPSQSVGFVNGALSDYGGKVETVATVRITDHNNALPGGGPFTDPATVIDFDLSYPVPCVFNPAGGGPPAIGGTCSVVTAASAIWPGGINIGNKRQNIQFGQVRVNDGGSSGQYMAPNRTLFETAGLFIP